MVKRNPAFTTGDVWNKQKIVGETEKLNWLAGFLNHQQSPTQTHVSFRRSKNCARIGPRSQQFPSEISSCPISIKFSKGGPWCEFQQLIINQMCSLGERKSHFQQNFFPKNTYKIIDSKIYRIWFLPPTSKTQRSICVASLVKHYGEELAFHSQWVLVTVDQLIYVYPPWNLLPKPLRINGRWILL